MKIVQWLFLLFVLMRVQPSFGMDGSHKKRNMLLGAGAVALVGAGGALTYWHMHDHEEPDLVRGAVGVSEAIPPEGQSHWKRNALIGGGILAAIAAGVVYVRGFWGGTKKGPAGDGQAREVESPQWDALRQSAGEGDSQGTLNAIKVELNNRNVVDDPRLHSEAYARKLSEEDLGCTFLLSPSVLPTPGRLYQLIVLLNCLIVTAPGYDSLAKMERVIIFDQGSLPQDGSIASQALRLKHRILFTQAFKEEREDYIRRRLQEQSRQDHELHARDATEPASELGPDGARLLSDVCATEAGDGGHELDQVGASGVQSPGAPKPESRRSIEPATHELSPVGLVEGVHEVLQEPAQPAAVVTTLRAVSPALEPQYAAQDELAAIETGLNDRNVSDDPDLHVNEAYLAQLSQDPSITQCAPPDRVSMELPLHKLIFRLNQLIVNAGGDCRLVGSGDLSQDDGLVSQAQRLKQCILFSRAFTTELSYYLERLGQLQKTEERGQLG